MKLENEGIHEINGLKLHTIETDKYKTNSIVLKLKAPLSEKTATIRALLPYVLQSGTKNFPSTLQIRSYLDDLYGATLNVDVSKKGEYQIISFRMDLANDKYLKSSTPLLEKGLEFIAQILLEPVINGDAFSSSIVDQEKRSLKQRIQAVYDDKMRYANMRLIEEMCQHEPYRIHTHGKMDEVNDITAESLYHYYQNVLNEDEIDLYIVGDILEDEVKQVVEKNFKLPSNRNVQYLKANVTSKQPAEEKEVFEEQDVKQGKLHLGYRTNITYGDEDYFALQLFNGIFGGFSHSKLFINVREKASLAYYAASRFESHKGLLLVMSGIEFANYEQAVNIIKEQMKHMKDGNFTDAELEQTKAVLKNQILETIDTANGMVEVLYHNVAANVKRSLNDWIVKVDQVTREDVINVGKNIQLDTIYFLKGMEGQM